MGERLKKIDNKISSHKFFLWSNYVNLVASLITIGLIVTSTITLFLNWKINYLLLPYN